MYKQFRNQDRVFGTQLWKLSLLLRMVLNFGWVMGVLLSCSQIGLWMGS